MEQAISRVRLSSEYQWLRAKCAENGVHLDTTFSADQVADLIRQYNLREEDAVQSRRRPTIMDGEVVTFATGFSQVEGVFGSSYPALGPFEVSASRNAVIVHRAGIRTVENCEQLIAALRMAIAVKERLPR